MAGPPRSNNPDVVSLRDYLEARIDGVTETMRATATSLDKRLEAMNEFRAAMNDQRVMLESRMSESVPRSEYVVQHRALETQVNTIDKWRSNMEGKASQTSVFGAYVVSIIGWVLAIGFGLAGILNK